MCGQAWGAASTAALEAWLGAPAVHCATGRQGRAPGPLGACLQGARVHRLTISRSCLSRALCLPACARPSSGGKGLAVQTGCKGSNPNQTLVLKRAAAGAGTVWPPSPCRAAMRRSSRRGQGAHAAGTALRCAGRRTRHTAAPSASQRPACSRRALPATAACSLLCRGCEARRSRAGCCLLGSQEPRCARLRCALCTVHRTTSDQLEGGVMPRAPDWMLALGLEWCTPASGQHRQAGRASAGTRAGSPAGCGGRLLRLRRGEPGPAPGTGAQPAAHGLSRSLHRPAAARGRPVRARTMLPCSQACPGVRLPCCRACSSTESRSSPPTQATCHRLGGRCSELPARLGAARQAGADLLTAGSSVL